MVELRSNDRPQRPPLHLGPPPDTRWSRRRCWPRTTCPGPEGGRPVSLPPGSPLSLSPSFELSIDLSIYLQSPSRPLSL